MRYSDTIISVDDTVHYFLLMVRAGAQVIVTQMVSTHEALMRGTLNFPNLIKLNDIMNDFKYELEVYAMVGVYSACLLLSRDSMIINSECLLVSAIFLFSGCYLLVLRLSALLY